MFLSYRNQSFDLKSKPMDWSLFDSNLRHEWVNEPIYCPTDKKYSPKEKNLVHYFNFFPGQTFIAQIQW